MDGVGVFRAVNQGLKSSVFDLPFAPPTAVADILGDGDDAVLGLVT
jgi:hypothetical protein